MQLGTSTSTGTEKRYYQQHGAGCQR